MHSHPCPCSKSRIVILKAAGPHVDNAHGRACKFEAESRERCGVHTAYVCTALKSPCFEVGKDVFQVLGVIVNILFVSPGVLYNNIEHSQQKEGFCSWSNGDVCID